MWSELPTTPIVARQAAGIRRISPEGRVIWAQVPSRAVSVAETPAERTSFAPPPGCISMLWICMPVGIFDSGRQLPTLGSAAGPFWTVIPAFRPSGATMYRFSPSWYWTRAIRAERFGSYSMCVTRAGTPSLSWRRKSMIRYIRLWPPPRWRTVMKPWLFRPPFFLSGSVRHFSGFLFLSVSSEKSLTDALRRPGLVGL